MNYDEAKKIPINAIRELIGHDPDYFPNCSDAVEYVEAYLKSCKEDHTRFDAVRWLNNMFKRENGVFSTTRNNTTEKTGEAQEWHISRLDELEDLALYRYLEQRGIYSDLSKDLLEEVYLHRKNRQEAMYVIGFRNERGGFALLGPFIDTLIGRKAISILRRGNGLPPTVHIFADFKDMLAALSSFPNLREIADVICLNSPELLDSAFEHIKGFGYRKVYSWFPINHLGTELSNKLTSLARTDKGLKHMLCDNVYQGHNDVASWHKANSKKSSSRSD